MARTHNNRYLVGERIKVVGGPYKEAGKHLYLVLGTVERDSLSGHTCFIRLDRVLSVGNKNSPKQHIEIQKHFILHLNVQNSGQEDDNHENIDTETSDDSDDSDDSDASDDSDDSDVSAVYVTE